MIIGKDDVVEKDFAGGVEKVELRKLTIKKKRKESGDSSPEDPPKDEDEKEPTSTPDPD